MPGSSLLYIGVAVVFWQESRGYTETLADRLLAVSFACWGAHWIADVPYPETRLGNFKALA